MSENTAVNDQSQDQQISVGRLDHQYNSELLPGIEVDYFGTRYEARLKRGGVDKYDSRLVWVTRDGLTIQLGPDDINAVLKILEKIRGAILSEELSVPHCIYCGDELDSVQEARTHHSERHEGRALKGGDGFSPEKYESDPNESVQELREQFERINNSEGADDG